MKVLFATGIRFFKALGYALEGLKSAFASEVAFRQELFLLAVATPVVFSLQLTAFERALMMGSLLLVLIVEIINTAFETTIERISPEQHPLSKKAKDLGAAAVLLSAVNALVIWLIILF